MPKPAKAPRWLPSRKSGLIQVRNITRLFLVTDYNGKSDIKASTIGPAMPFTVEEYDSEEEATEALARLHALLEL